MLTGTAEREVRKASRELNNQTSKLDDIQKIEALQKRCADLFAEMKRLERDNLKNKKRGDQLQKEKDHSRTELSKNVSLREKLEKLCRELQRENNRLKVSLPSLLWIRCCDGDRGRGNYAFVVREANQNFRLRTRHYKMLISRITKAGMQNTKICCGNCKTTKKRKTTPRLRL
jgi:predicted RNase H-like nuclease (RuvC/YqgF family)